MTKAPAPEFNRKTLQRVEWLRTGELTFVCKTMRAELDAELTRLNYTDEMMAALPGMPPGFVQNVQNWLHIKPSYAKQVVWDKGIETLKAATPQTIIALEDEQRAEFKACIERTKSNVRGCEFDDLDLSLAERIAIMRADKTVYIEGERWERALERVKTLTENLPASAAEPSI